MTITASMVKELREMSGAGMMDAKKALEENGADINAAMDWLRQKGIAKAAKKSGRVAAEGLVQVATTSGLGAVVEVNSETDFVAKNETFGAFVNELAQHVLDNKLSTETVAESTMGGKAVSERVTDLVAKIGENIQFRRATTLAGDTVAGYVHMGGKIGVLVALDGATGAEAEAAAKQVAMHVAATNPAALDRDSINPELVEREKKIFTEQARESGKPDNIIEKMIDGRINKYYQEQCLVEQAFVIDTDKTVAEFVSSLGSDAKVSGFIRYELGEGIEKKQEDFAAEVAAATKAA